MAAATGSLRSLAFINTTSSSPSCAAAYQLLRRNPSSAFFSQTLLPVQNGVLVRRNGGNNYKRPTNSVVTMVKPTILFIRGTDEQTIPDVRLSKSRDGTDGMAIFLFEQPCVFDSSGDMGDITGFYMIDDEGVRQSVYVSAKFVNGKPAGIEAKYVMRTPKDWDQFMWFKERYSNENGLQFVKK